MRAVVVHEFGGPDRLVVEERPDPRPGPGEVVVDVAAIDVLWVETMIRSGRGGSYFGVRPPYVPGNAVTGRVRAVGDGVDPAWTGRPVAARTGGAGGYAEQVVAAAAGLSPLPAGLEPTTAAALLHDLPTALLLLDAARVGPGHRVLVVGVSGGLGLVSVQLARSRGAEVVATARDERKLRRLRELGVGPLVDSESPDWVDRARAALGDAADVVLDNVGGAVGEAAFELVAPGGSFSAHGTPSGRFAAIDPDLARDRGVAVRGIRDVQVDGSERTALTDRALAEAAAGHVTPVIGQTFPLSEAAAAHAAIEARTVFGSTLLLPDR